MGATVANWSFFKSLPNSDSPCAAIKAQRCLKPETSLTVRAPKSCDGCGLARGRAAAIPRFARPRLKGSGEARAHTTLASTTPGNWGLPEVSALRRTAPGAFTGSAPRDRHDRVQHMAGSRHSSAKKLHLERIILSEQGIGRPGSHGCERCYMVLPPRFRDPISCVSGRETRHAVR